MPTNVGRLIDAARLSIDRNVYPIAGMSGSAAGITKLYEHVNARSYSEPLSGVVLP